MAAPRRRGVRRARRNRRRARARKSRGPGWKLWLGAALALVVGVNGAVRACGGDAAYLSLRYLPEKVRALLALACHAPRHAFGNPHPPAAHALAVAARAEGVPYRVALAMAHAESSLDPHVISGTGAMGLMQLMPATAKEQGVDDPFDTTDSARGGVRYLGSLLRYYRGDTMRAVAAYNAGPGRVPRRGAVPVLPLETRNYVRRVLVSSP